ncbi:transglutaminase family protein [Leptothrix sp. BB-4]
MTARSWPGLAGLPRERRDTLFMLAVLAWTLAPLAAHVPAWASVGAAGALLWRLVVTWRGHALPPRWLLTLLLIASVGAVALTWRSLGGKDAGLALLVVLAALKTLELRARRDAQVLFFLGFFLVLSNFLHSQSLAIALAMGAAVWGLLAALLLSHMPVGQPSLGQVAGKAARLMLTGAPLVAVLFVFFPRIAPLWGVPGEAGGRTGLSNELQLGDVAELALDDRLALRVQFDGPPPPPQALYFRGPVLSQPDGARWTVLPWRTGAALPDGLDPRRQTEQVLPSDLRYVMTVEPLRVATLPLLENVLGVPEPVGGGEPGLQLVPHPEGSWFASQPLTDRLQVRAAARRDARAPGLPEDLMNGVLSNWIALPDGLHPRTRAWAADLARQPAIADAPGPARRADVIAVALIAHIRQAGYAYTLSPGDLGGQPLDAFWLDTRAGFCEHYATAFVVVMRSLGVPARIVTGYQGGTVNPIDGVLEVRQSDAHAWAEYWRAGDGWVKVDPTAAIAPERVRGNQRLVAPRGLVAGALANVDPALLERMRAVWSALDHRWNQWVLGHGRQRQLDLLRSLGWADADLVGLGRGLAMALTLLATLGAMLAAWQARHPRVRDPWLRGWQSLRRDLARRGIASAANDTPRTLADRLDDPAAASAVRALERLRYHPDGAHDGARSIDERFAEARRAVRQMASTR